VSTTKESSSKFSAHAEGAFGALGESVTEGAFGAEGESVAEGAFGEN
jgi:hypothetical protein